MQILNNINPEITKILKQHNITNNAHIGILFLLNNGFTPTNSPQLFNPILQREVLATGIVKCHQEQNGTFLFHFEVPLLSTSENAWDWVQDYCNMFKKANLQSGGYVREATIRLKKLFSTNPEIRKDDILGATELYLKNTDPKFIGLPHYFIEKGVGSNKTQKVLTWVENYLELKVQGAETYLNTLQ
jgi:hypothetical protein